MEGAERAYERNLCRHSRGSGLHRAGRRRSSAVSDGDLRHLPALQPIRTAHQAGSGDGPSLALLRRDGDSQSGHGRLCESAQHQSHGGEPDAHRAERAAEGHCGADQLQPLRHRTGRPAEAVCLSAGQGPGGYGERRDGGARRGPVERQRHQPERAHDHAIHGLRGADRGRRQLGDRDHLDEDRGHDQDHGGADGGQHRLPCAAHGDLRQPGAAGPDRPGDEVASTTWC